MPFLKPAGMCDIVTGMQYQGSTALVKASPQVVWSLSTDYDRLTKRFTNMKSSEMVRPSESGKVFQQPVQPPEQIMPTVLRELCECAERLATADGGTEPT